MTTPLWAVPGYTEIRELGRGSQGRVVLARRDSDGETVAIKYLEPHLLSDDEEASLFRTEAETLAQVDDPNVARIFSYVETDDGAAIIMEPINGVTLRAILRDHENGLEPQAALAILKGSLLGLAAAHEKGLVHRDYKPANVMVQDDDGNSRLIDFGIAVLSGGGGRVGTPAYMAPEQWQGSPASPATDIYAATCVFYECVAGKSPYLGDTTQPDTTTSLEQLHISGPIPTRDIQRGLRSLVTRGMAKDPRERPENADAFVAELETAAQAAYGPDWESVGRAALTAAAVALLATGGASSAALVAHTARAGLSHGARAKIGAGVGGLAVAGGVAAYVLWPTTHHPPPPPPALTLAQAQQVLAHYLTVANKADNDLDTNLLATVESKPELDMDASYFAFSGKHHLGPVKPTDVRQPQFWIPRIAGSAQRWFVVHTGPGSTVGWTWYTNADIPSDPGAGHTRTSANSTLLFTRQSGGTWKLSLIADPPKAGTAYPQPILDPQGYAQEVTPTATGYAMTPQSIPYLMTSDQGKGRFGQDTCSSTPQTPKDATTPPAIAKTGWDYTVTAHPSAYRVYALKTNRAAAVVWITLNATTDMHKTNPRSGWGYGVDYSGVKAAHAWYANRIHLDRIGITVMINPEKTAQGPAASLSSSASKTPASISPSAATAAPKPARLACSATTISFNGN